MISHKSPPEVIVQAIEWILSEFEYSGQYSFRFVVRPLVRRLSRDDTLVQLLAERLGPAAPESEKATIPRLITEAKGLTEELRSWALNELISQNTRPIGVGLGVDLVAQRVQPV